MVLTNILFKKKEKEKKWQWPSRVLGYSFKLYHFEAFL